MKYINSTFVLFLFLVSCKKEVIEPKIETPINTDVDFNGNFESWTIITQNAISFEEPSGGFWATLNPLAKLNGPITVVKTNDAQNGNYAALLETKDWGNITIPGLLVSGVFLPQDPFVFQGKPYTNRPYSINGYYKYLPQNGDSAVIYSKLSRFNPIKGQQDTIAQMSFIVSSETPNYTLFSLVFDYTSDLIPDSITITFVSSIQGNNFKGQSGSKLFIDNVSIIQTQNK